MINPIRKPFGLSVRMPHLVLAITCLSIFSLPLSGCKKSEKDGFLGSAQMDADHYTLSPSLAGTLVAVFKKEGDSVQAGEIIALLDTIPLHWQREELIASHVELQATLRAKSQEIAAISTEAGGVERDLKRIGSLVQSGSAPEQQEDKLRTALQSTREKQRAIAAGAEGLKSKQTGLNAKLNWLDEQLKRCEVRAPVSGKILTRYRNVGEMASPAQPIFEMSRTDTLRADFYVPQPFLAQLSLGKTVFIRVDTENKSAQYIPATIAYISDESEFAPKNIQTRESRNELVFEVRVVTPGSGGVLKRGMPVEIWKDAQP